MSDTADAASWDRRGEKVSSVVAREIVRDIVRQQLAPGTTLEPETVMLRRYRVARGSLREALRILEMHGIIRIKPGPGGGPLVAEVHSSDFGRMATLFFQVRGVRFADLVEARLLLEPMMARLAAERCTPEQAKELRAVVEAGTEAADDAGWHEASKDFHGKVLSMSGNGLLDLVAGSIKEIYHDRVTDLLYRGRQREQIKKVHAQIADAITAGDADTAGRLMHEHMVDFAKAASKRDARLMDEVVDWR